MNWKKKILIRRNLITINTMFPFDSNSTGYTNSKLYLSTKYLMKKNIQPNGTISGIVVEKLNVRANTVTEKE
jgi:hypothetical protein